MSKITALIHKIKYEPQAKRSTEIVREFSLQILHQPIHFTTMKFCVINYNLMASVKSLNIFMYSSLNFKFFRSLSELHQIYSFCFS